MSQAENANSTTASQRPLPAIAAQGSFDGLRRQVEAAWASYDAKYEKVSALYGADVMPAAPEEIRLDSLPPGLVWWLEKAPRGTGNVMVLVSEDRSWVTSFGWQYLLDEERSHPQCPKLHRGHERQWLSAMMHIALQFQATYEQVWRAELHLADQATGEAYDRLEDLETQLFRLKPTSISDLRIWAEIATRKAGDSEYADDQVKTIIDTLLHFGEEAGTVRQPQTETDAPLSEVARLFRLWQAHYETIDGNIPGETVEENALRLQPFWDIDHEMMGTHPTSLDDIKLQFFAATREGADTAVLTSGLETLLRTIAATDAGPNAISTSLVWKFKDS